MKSASTPTPEKVFLRPNSQAPLRLFCFPYAGAGASVFREWANGLPAEIEVIPLQLPGRESRIREPSLKRVGPLVDMLVADLGDLSRPFSFFGHSMGALVSYELARKLRDQGKPGPIHLFVSGRRAPGIPDETQLMHQLDDRALLQKLRELNGTPEEIFQYPELVSFWLQILRADLEACETYVYAKGAPLYCPITTFGGLEDPHVSRDEIEAWRDYTQGDFTLHMLPGDHFFLRHSRGTLLRTIARDLKATALSSGRWFESDRVIAV